MVTLPIHVIYVTDATPLIYGIKQLYGTLKTLPVKQVDNLLGYTNSQITEIFYVKRDTSRLSGLADEFNL